MRAMNPGGYGQGTLLGSMLARVAVVAALLALMGVGMIMMASPAQAADFFVTSNADAGPGTLRGAVTTANANGAADNIYFNLPSDQRTITLINQISFTEAQQTAIYGETAGVTVSGGGTTRVFYVGNNANLSINDLTVSGGSANGSTDRGGGIYNEGGTLNVTDSTISNNSASFGGGIYNFAGNLTVTASTINGNSATVGGGGGITSYLGPLNITASTISDNSASAGGGIANSEGNANIKDSTISGNDVSGQGGGVFSNTNLYADSDGGVKTAIENSTISGNTAGSRGGGVNNDDGLTTIRSTTITNNTAPENQGAGVMSLDATFVKTEVSSSIIAANSSTDVDFLVHDNSSVNPFVSNGYNLIGDGNATGAFNKTGDQIIANNSPGLGPLADNGGSTQTHALLTSSPALDAAGACTGTDQRGVSRPQGTACDTGSFELVNAAPTISVVAGSASNSACLAANRGRLTLKISDADGDPLSLSATSSNTTLVPTSNITFGGTEDTRTATITTVSGQTGTSNLKIKVSDGQKRSTVPVTVQAGGSANNTLSGTTGADLLLGQGGADTLDGLGSSDVLCGAAGNDSLRGGSGADTFDGGTGTDTTSDYSAAQGDARINIP